MLTHGTFGGLLSSMAQTAPGETGQLSFAVLHSTSGPALDRGVCWVSGRAPCLAAVCRKVRPTHQVENSRATFELALIRLLWRHACEARGIGA